MPELPLRARIALNICAVSTALLVLMSLAVYVSFKRQLTANLDDTLRLRAAANMQLITVTDAAPVLAASDDPGQERAAAEAVLRLYSRDGTLLLDASPATGLTAAERDVVLSALRSQREAFRTIDLGDNEDYRIVASPIDTAGGVSGVLVTGVEWSRVNKPLAILRLTLLLAVPATALALALGGYWIARGALRPVAAMTATARQITEGDLRRRISGAGARDELGRLASTLNAMIARLNETADRERRFTSDASHELRTPLAAIEASIDVTLAHEREPAEYRRVLGVVRQQTQRLHTLARQLLLLARLDAQDMRANGGFAPVNLGELVEVVVAAFSARQPLARLSVEIETAAGPLETSGNLELLARALDNLLENAVKHAGATVAISVTVRRLAGTTALLSVEDDGPGVAPELAPTMFQRFRRGDSAQSSAGTGLGLAIVEAILRAHDGAVRLMPPQPGRGARFELTLPLVATR